VPRDLDDRRRGRSASRPASRPAAIGARAEEAVARHLAALGLEILAVNLRVGRLELDVVARDGPVIAVVEVRTRGPGAWQRALDSIDPRKQARVRAAGERLWRQRFAGDRRAERMRFDAAAVELLPDGGARVEIVKAAF
jgi:putative endonuclease